MKQKMFNAVKGYFINRSLKQQQQAWLPDVGLWGLAINEQRHLAVDGVNTLMVT